MIPVLDINKIIATFILFVCGFFLLSFEINAQQNKKNKKTEIDDAPTVTIPSKPLTTVKDSTSKDSVKLYEPLKSFGSISNSNIINSFDKISKKDLLWMDYSSLFEVLKEKLPVQPLSLGNYGQFNSFRIFGGYPKDLSTSFNTRMMNDIEYGSYNLTQFSPEYLESIEILTGSDAAIIGANSSGALLNIQQIKYNTSVPYTKMWFYKSANNMIGADGVFSQNIAPNLNMTFGFKSQGENGPYKNQWVEAWQLRGFLRWNISKLTNISISENFNNHSIGTNGGIHQDSSSNIFDPLGQDIKLYYDNLDERVYRHDLTASFLTLSDSMGTTSLSTNIYYSGAEWNRRLPANVFGITSDTIIINRYYSNFYGFNANYEQQLTNDMTLKIGGEFNYLNQEKSFYSTEYKGINSGIFGLLLFKLFDKFNLSGGIRLTNTNGIVNISLGSKLEYTDRKSYSYFADLSISPRTPTIAEGLGLKSEKNTLLILGIKRETDNSTNKLSLYSRLTASPILNGYILDSITNQILNVNSFNGSTRFSSGISWITQFDMSEKLKFNGRMNVDYYSNSKNLDFSAPNIYLFASPYYSIKVNKSEVRLGLELEVIYRKNWDQFVPQKRVYVEVLNNPQFFFNGFNIFAHGKFGQTYVKLSFNNLLNTGYYTTAYYPDLGRYFKLDVSWAFTD